MILMPSVPNTSSKGGGELRVSVADEEFDRLGTLTQDQTQVAGLLGYPRPDWIGGDAREVDPPGVDLEEEQHVEAPQKHGVDREEVASQHGRRLRSEKLGPGRTLSPGRGLDAVSGKDGPDARGGESNAHGRQLPMDPTVSPRRILRRQPKDEVHGAGLATPAVPSRRCG